MKNITRKILLTLVLGLLLGSVLLGFVSAVPPVTQIQQFAEGYIIEGSPQEIVKQNQDYQYNFFLYNISNGVQLSNQSIRCLFYMANTSGYVKVATNVLYFDGYWGLILNGKNFTSLGNHPFGIKCNSTTLGGSFVSFFKVTATGEEFDIAKSGLSIGVILTILIIMFFFGFLGMKFMENERTSAYGLFFLVLGLMLSMYGLFSGYVLSRDYLFTSISSVYEKVFIGTLLGISGISIIAMLFLLVSAVKELKIQKTNKKYGDGYNRNTKQYEY
jgi:hypothetical protein